MEVEVEVEAEVAERRWRRRWPAAGRVMSHLHLAVVHERRGVGDVAALDLLRVCGHFPPVLVVPLHHIHTDLHVVLEKRGSGRGESGAWGSRREGPRGGGVGGVSHLRAALLAAVGVFVPHRLAAVGRHVAGVVLH